MQVTETLNEGLKRGYEMTILASDLDATINEKLIEAQPTVEMKGFRKGKVPIALLKRQFGQRLLGETMQESIDKAMTKHFEDSGDRPAQKPDVKMTNENWKEGDDVHVELTYEALPSIPEVNFKEINLEKLVVKSDAASVEESLAKLAENAQDFKDRKKNSKAKEGDQIVLDFSGNVDGEAFDGGSSEDYPLVLGSNSFIPGFEEQLIGVKVGEKKDVTVTFPEDYGAKHLAEKEAVFACNVKAIKQPVAADINDTLAKKFGSPDLASLKIQIGERLQAEYAGAARTVMKRSLMDELDKILSFELPPSMVESEASQIAHQFRNEKHPDVKDHEHTDIEVTQEHKDLAARRVRLGLLLAELGQRADIQVSDAEIQQAVMAQARQYPGEERQFMEFVKNNEQMQQQVRAPIFEDKVVDYVFELSSVIEKEVSREDLQKAVEALEGE